MVVCLPREKLLLFSVYVYYAIIGSWLVAECFAFIFRQKSLGSRLVAEIGLQANKYSTLTLVRPKLEYASSVWNPYKQCNIDKIEMVQCRVARFVFSDYSHCSHVSVMINKLGLSRASQTTQSSVYVLQIYKEQLFIYICLFMHFY